MFVSMRSCVNNHDKTVTTDTGNNWRQTTSHYGDVIMGAISSQIISLTIVYSTVYLDADKRKHQSCSSLAFVRGIHRRPVNSPHKWPVTRKMFPFDDVIMKHCNCNRNDNDDVEMGHDLKYNAINTLATGSRWLLLHENWFQEHFLGGGKRLSFEIIFYKILLVTHHHCVSCLVSGRR